MANTKGSTNIRSTMYNGKHSLLPPKSPFPSISPSYVDYGPSPAVGPKGIAKPREMISHHHRTTSESFLTEEQPSWLDELLNEPETPVRRGGHRRSSSDSFAYGDVSNASIADYVTQGDYGSKNMNLVPSWGSQDFGYYKDVRRVSMTKPKTWGRDSSMNLPSHSSGVLFARDNAISQNSGSSADRAPSPTIEKQNADESGHHDPKVVSERNDPSHAKSFASETDTKRAKQQFAQRSRVRKLQYIAELERNVQVLQVEGTEVSAELEFVNQQNLILSMENKALKQRIESLAQEQLIKYLEHEVLEREVGRLRSVFQQQQKPQQLPPSCGHRRTKSRDLDSQFANLSLKHKDTSSGCDSVSGTVQI